MVEGLLIIVGFIGIMMFMWELILLMVGSMSFSGSLLFLSIISFIGSIVIGVWYDEKNMGKKENVKQNYFLMNIKKIILMKIMQRFVLDKIQNYYI